MKIFLSYASEDRKPAEELAVSLRDRGHTVFLDRDDLPPGNTYNEKIRSEILKSQLFIFLVSPDSVRKGKYTLTELEIARSKWPSPKSSVLPVLVRDTTWDEIPGYLSSITVLEPQGNLVAEVIHNLEECRRSRRLIRVGSTVAAALVIFVAAVVAARLGSGTTDVNTISVESSPFQLLGTPAVTAEQQRTLRLVSNNPDQTQGYRCEVTMKNQDQIELHSDHKNCSQIKLEGRDLSVPIEQYSEFAAGGLRDTPGQELDITVRGADNQLLFRQVFPITFVPKLDGAPTTTAFISSVDIDPLPISADKLSTVRITRAGETLDDNYICRVGLLAGLKSNHDGKSCTFDVTLNKATFRMISRPTEQSNFVDFSVLIYRTENPTTVAGSASATATIDTSFLDTEKDDAKNFDINTLDLSWISDGQQPILIIGNIEEIPEGIALEIVNTSRPAMRPVGQDRRNKSRIPLGTATMNCFMSATSAGMDIELENCDLSVVLLKAYYSVSGNQSGRRLQGATLEQRQQLEEAASIFGDAGLSLFDTGELVGQRTLEGVKRAGPQ